MSSVEKTTKELIEIISKHADHFPDFLKYPEDINRIIKAIELQKIIEQNPFKDILDGIDNFIKEYDKNIEFFKSYKVGGGHQMTPLMNDRINDTKRMQRRLLLLKEAIDEKIKELSK